MLLSEDTLNEEWDRFVEFEANGQFEQTSRWANVKSSSGWETARMILSLDKKIIAGNQILHRNVPILGKVGYLSKGPLVTGVDSSLPDKIVKELKKKIEDLKLFYLIAQPPDGDNAMSGCLEKRGFLKDGVVHVTSATTMVDLTQDDKLLLSRMTRNFRYNIRFAEKNGIIIREGGQEDISLFFKLMLETCKRQGVPPNPSTESFIQKLWGLFAPQGNIVLLLAHLRGEIVSALIGIPFGKVFNAWKMGWSGRHENSRANHLLHWKAMQWAKERGYRSYDFMGVSRSIAEAILQGKHFYQVAKGSDLFKFSFGGAIRLLPEAYFYIGNPILRFGYSGIYPKLRTFKMFGKHPFRFKNDIF